MIISKDDTISNTDLTGFTKEDCEDMQRIFTSFPSLEKVILFGSRAMGKQALASDVDLAVFSNDENITLHLKTALEEGTNIPYFFDIISFKSITSPELKEHIRLHGLTIYEKL